MTQEQESELSELKAALKQHIVEADKSTTGPWDYEGFGIYADGHLTAKIGAAIGDCGVTENNAAFIARARTMSPLACRIALEAIKALEEIVAEDKDHLMAADHDLIFILNLWKGGQS